MEAGSVKEFVNNLTIQDEMVRYDDHLYYFYGIRYDSDRNVYYTSIDQFGTDIHHFEREFYYYESSDIADCLEHLISDKYWNGKDFYEVEATMKWVDG